MHDGSYLSILETHETLFFSHHAGSLCQWIRLTIANRLARPLRGTLAIDAHGMEIVTPLELMPGIREYRGYAPMLWPDHAPMPDAHVYLEAEGQRASATVSVGTHRPWTVYLLSDVCTDYTWVYGDEAACRADDAALTEAELALAEGSAPDNHYNLVHSREIEFYLERYPERAERLLAHLRRGTLTLNPFWNMSLTHAMSLEELMRQFYPARAWAVQHGLELGYANHQETPSIAWIMATILAQSGIKHLIKAIYPYECPWAKRLEEPPLFIWEGPDGSRVLYRRRNTDYTEGNIVLRSLRATNTALHDTILPNYEKLGESYPYDAISLLGCYGDLSPRSAELPAKKAATIAAYNAQGWEYPKLMNAAHKQYWDHVDAQIAARRLQPPVYRGDYGAAWDVWPACLAHDLAGWRRAQERAGLADRLAAILWCLERPWYEGQHARLAEGWTNLLALADHAWNGANEANWTLNTALRRRWQTAATQAFDQVVAEGLQALARRVPTDERESILVFNGLPWARDGVVHAPGVGPGAAIVDATSSKPVATQTVEEDGKPALYFCAEEVPSLGYRLYTIAAPEAEASSPAGPWIRTEGSLEGPFYRLTLSPITGGIVSLYDKVRGRELVDPASPYHLNQCLYFSEDKLHTPSGATFEPGSSGPLFAQMRVRAALKNMSVTTTITLYAHLDRVDIRNEVDKLPSSEKQELDFAFPFRVPERQVRYEAPGALIDPDTELRPGAGRAWTVVRHMVDLFNADYGVTFSQADAGAVQFGHRTSVEDPLAPDAAHSTLLALALENSIDWHEAVRDQAGITHFLFRYSLRGHVGGFDPVGAIHLGWEDNNALEAIRLPAGQKGHLPTRAHSFLQVQPDHAVLTCLKVAEEQGLVARLWECAGQAVTAHIRLTGLGKLADARNTDPLERDLGALPMTEGLVDVNMPGRGLAAARLLLDREESAD